MRNANERNLTGVWNGLYTYESGLSVSFVATLIDSGSALCGMTHEANVFGRQPGNTLCASLSGRCSDSLVAFVKTYDNPHYDPIRYEGGLNGDATEIEGCWRIADGSVGKFLMIRSNGKAASVERKQAVRV
jgi:hypothetical protein